MTEAMKEAARKWAMSRAETLAELLTTIRDEHAAGVAEGWSGVAKWHEEKAAALRSKERGLVTPSFNPHNAMLVAEAEQHERYARAIREAKP